MKNRFARDCCCDDCSCTAFQSHFGWDYFTPGETDAIVFEDEVDDEPVWKIAIAFDTDAYEFDTEPVTRAWLISVLADGENEILFAIDETLPADLASFDALWSATAAGQTPRTSPDWTDLVPTTDTASITVLIKSGSAETLATARKAKLRIHIDEDAEEGLITLEKYAYDWRLHWIRESAGVYRSLNPLPCRGVSLDMAEFHDLAATTDRTFGLELLTIDDTDAETTIFEVDFASYEIPDPVPEEYKIFGDYPVNRLESNSTFTWPDVDIDSHWLVSDGSVGEIIHSTNFNRILAAGSGTLSFFGYLEIGEFIFRRSGVEFTSGCTAGTPPELWGERVYFPVNLACDVEVYVRIHAGGDTPRFLDTVTVHQIYDPETNTQDLCPVVKPLQIYSLPFSHHNAIATRVSIATIDLEARVVGNYTDVRSLDLSNQGDICFAGYGKGLRDPAIRSLVVPAYDDGTNTVVGPVSATFEPYATVGCNTYITDSYQFVSSSTPATTALASAPSPLIKSEGGKRLWGRRHFWYREGAYEYEGQDYIPDFDEMLTDEQIEDVAESLAAVASGSYGYGGPLFYFRVGCAKYYTIDAAGTVLLVDGLDFTPLVPFIRVECWFAFYTIFGSNPASVTWLRGPSVPGTRPGTQPGDTPFGIIVPEQVGGPDSITGTGSISNTRKYHKHVRAWPRSAPAPFTLDSTDLMPGESIPGSEISIVTNVDIPTQNLVRVSDPVWRYSGTVSGVNALLSDVEIGFNGA